MRTHTRLAQRIAVVAAMALIVALAAVGGASSATATGPGESNHCPAESTQVRFEGAGEKEGFTVTVVDSQYWTWEYDGELVIESVYVFGGNTLVSVPGVAGTTAGIIDAVALNLLNVGGEIADISHVDFCLGGTEVETYEVIPVKVWDFGDADIPADGQAVITIDAGVLGSKSWTFDSQGNRDNDIPLVLPKGHTYTVGESFTQPDGFTCALDEIVKVTDLNGDQTVEVYNTCVADDNGNGNGGTLPPFVPPPVLPPPETPAEPDEAVLDEVVEAPATTEAVEVAGEQLPRTGGESAGLAMAAVAALTLGAGLTAVARRRELVS
jgi:LPXTG-motif cell wall-anchored protein